MSIWAKREENRKHPWRVGDLCTAVYDNRGEGLIYRVTEVIDGASSGQFDRAHVSLVVKPVYGVVADVKGRKTRTLGAGYCTPLSLIDLATEYTRFGLFISQEAKRRGAEPEADPEEVSTRDAGDVEGRPAPDDGGGLCADIASRDEVG